MATTWQQIKKIIVHVPTTVWSFVTTHAGLKMSQSGPIWASPDGQSHLKHAKVGGKGTNWHCAHAAHLGSQWRREKKKCVLPCKSVHWQGVSVEASSKLRQLSASVWKIFFYDNKVGFAFTILYKMRQYRRLMQIIYFFYVLLDLSYRRVSTSADNGANKVLLQRPWVFWNVSLTASSTHLASSTFTLLHHMGDSVHLQLSLRVRALHIPSATRTGVTIKPVVASPTYFDMFQHAAEPRSSERERLNSMFVGRGAHQFARLRPRVFQLEDNFMQRGWKNNTQERLPNNNQQENSHELLLTHLGSNTLF